MIEKFKSHYRHVHTSLFTMDWYFLAMLVLYTALTLIFWKDVPLRWTIITENVVFGSVCLAVVGLITSNSSWFLQGIRKFYVIPFVYPIYAQTHMLLHPLRTALYDSEFIAMDQAIFGLNPTQWLLQFSHPVLTEYFQLCYVAFFFLPGIHAIMLFVQHRYAEAELLSRIMVFSFFVSYIAYFAFPAVGPRFTLHNYSTLQTELPGVYVTQFLREQVSEGGGISTASSNPSVSVNRDCMPSGHTMMTFLNIILAWRFRSRFRWFFTVIGSSLIMATVYLRYHYVVDVIAGVLFVPPLLILEPKINAWLKKHGFVLQT